MTGPGGGGATGSAGLRLLSRGESVLVGLLLALSGAAWWVTNRLATPDMRLGILTGAADSAMDPSTAPGSPSMAPSADPSMAGPMTGSMSMGLGLFLVTWVVMMAAMMLPSAAPVVVGATRLAAARGARTRTGYGLTAGYLMVWALIGVAAYGLFLGFQAVVSAGDVTAARVGGAVLLSAGVFQLTPLKRVCLRHCRSPLALLAHYGEALYRGQLGAFGVGVRHGGYCVGCCWAFMAVLLAAGMMSLAWMAAIAAIVLAEKVLPRGEALSGVLGVSLIGLGVAVLAAPGLVPALA